MSDLKLAELLIAKFCHDIAGAIGAVNNAVDFLQERDTDIVDKAFQLLQESSKQAVTRLIFYRQAYGLSDTLGEANLNALKTITNDYLLNSKVKLNWAEQFTYLNDAIINGQHGKIILNLVHICYGILIHGGEITVKIEKDGPQRKITISASGERVRFDETLPIFLNLNNAGIELSHKNIHFYYLGLLIKEMQASISINNDANTVTFIVIN